MSAATKEVTVSKGFALNEVTGLPVMKTLQDQMQYATFLINGGFLPKSYVEPGQVVSAMQLAAELGLQPGVKTLSRTANINGTPSIWGELPLSIMQNSGKMAEYECFYFTDKHEKICFANKNLDAPIFGFLFRSRRVNATVWNEDYYTTKMAKDAGLYDKTGSVWKKHPEDLLRWRTTGKHGKAHYGDLLSGVPIAEYDHNTIVEPSATKVTSMVTAETENKANKVFADIIDITPVEVIEPVTAKAEPVVVQEKEIVVEKKKETKKEVKTEAPLVVDVKAEVSVKESELAELAQYKVKIGKNTGKLLAELNDAEVESLIAGSQRFVDKENKTEEEMKLLDTIKETLLKAKTFKSVMAL